ncbi:MAG: diguanylate cyclase [Spirochaetales bacterium]|nr:diguanylate cyclase [Spirochaetales bacterium]
MHKYLFFLLFSFSLFSQATDLSQGRDFYFDRLDREDGLSHPSVSAIVQDSQGFLWVGTQDGLNRYDGREFLTFEHKPFKSAGLPNNQIQSLYMGAGDILWIGTYGGLSRFDIHGLNFTNYANDPEDPNSLLGSVVTAVCESRDGVWVGTLGGLCLLDETKGRFVRFTHSDEDPFSLPDNNIRALLCDSSQRLWIGSNKGLSLYLGEGKFQTWPLGETGTEKTLSKAVMSLKETADGDLAAGLWEGGVLLFNREEGSIRKNFLLPDNRLYYVYPDGKYIWAGTWGGGLYHINSETGEQLHLKGNGGKGELDGMLMYSLCKDNNGTYWIGTKSQGLFKLDPNKRKALIYSNDPLNPRSLGKGEITELHFDKNDALWVGTYANGLYKQVGEGNDFVRYGREEDAPHRLDDNRVTLLYTDKKERLWLGTTEGLHLYNEATGAFEVILFDNRYPLEEQDIVYSMTEDEEGNFWIGTYNRGVIVRNSSWAAPRYYDNTLKGGLSDNLIADIICDSAGDIWMATNGGVNHYSQKDEKFYHYRYNEKNPQGINTDHVRYIYEDTHHRLWVGTSEGGLNLMEGEIGADKNDFDSEKVRWIKYTKQDGLPHNRIMKLQEDGLGNLWASTSYGLARFDREQSSFTTIPREEGLFSPEFSVGATVDSKGNLYFGSHEGVNFFSLESQYGNTREAKVVITDVQVHRNSLFPEGTIYNNRQLTLNYEERYLEIGYSALDLLSSGNNRFSYRLDGFEKNWHYAGDRTEASYSNIPPGKYTFRVKGSNNAGVWSTDEAQLYITIKPPPWRSPWALFLYALGAVVLAILLFLAIHHHFSLQKIKELEKMKRELEEANNQLTILSGQDGLTGVNNRRQFDTMVRELWDNLQRTEQPLAFLMMDIDYFKAYNDSYGHQQGDTCLITLAKIFQEALPRTTDKVFRYGGEEFCLLLPGTNKDGALLIAQRIHERLRKSKIEHRSSNLSPYVTISIGIAVSSPEKEENLSEFINRADQSCYLAKKRGRNQTCMDEESFF